MRRTAFSDNELLAAWRIGDRSAGGELIDRHVAPVRRFFHRNIARQADDLLQRTLLVCTEQRDNFRGGSSFRTFLLAIARNVLVDELRRRGREPARASVEAESLPSNQDSQCEVVADKERRSTVRRALPVLAPEYRVVLELALMRDMTCRELADALKINEHTVRSRLVRGRDALRRAVDSR